MTQYNINSVNTLHIHNPKPSHPYFEVKPHSQIDRADAYLDGTIGVVQELISNDENRELRSLLYLINLNLDTVRDMLNQPTDQ